VSWGWWRHGIAGHTPGPGTGLSVHGFQTCISVLHACGSALHLQGTELWHMCWHLGARPVQQGQGEQLTMPMDSQAAALYQLFVWSWVPLSTVDNSDRVVRGRCHRCALLQLCSIRIPTCTDRLVYMCGGSSSGGMVQSCQKLMYAPCGMCALFTAVAVL
jgi:hypothetical protein